MLAARLTRSKRLPQHCATLAFIELQSTWDIYAFCIRRYINENPTQQKIEGKRFREWEKETKSNDYVWSAKQQIGNIFSLKMDVRKVDDKDTHLDLFQMAQKASKIKLCDMKRWSWNKSECSLFWNLWQILFFSSRCSLVEQLRVQHVWIYYF